MKNKKKYTGFTDDDMRRILKDGRYNIAPWPDQIPDYVRNVLGFSEEEIAEIEKEQESNNSPQNN